MRLPLLPDDGVYVLEMSSYMLERIATLRFDVAAMLNLSPTISTATATWTGMPRPSDIFSIVRRTAISAVVGVDDERLTRPWQLLRYRAMDVIDFSAHLPISGMWVRDGELVLDGETIASLRMARALPGRHNAQNAAAAAAMAVAFGLVAEPDRGRPRRPFPACRTARSASATIDGVTFVNDSKATNADSAARALACYDR